ncbi:MAG: glycosyltransferase family 2 protein [Phycisphaerales bacterium]|nr:glycosyltransferase family 2 protein [Phycisphaerales bacterium]
MPIPRDIFASLSLVIPVYNGSRVLRGTLADAHTYLTALDIPFEVIVVDDGSTDDSAAIAAGFGSSLPGPTLRLIRSTPNRGKGHAVRIGMLAAEHDWVLFMDADHSTSIRHLDRFAPVAAGLIGAPATSRPPSSRPGIVVIASRRLSTARIVRRQHPIRQALGRTFPYLVRLLAVSDLADTQCGFKLFTRTAAQSVFSRLRTEGFAFDVEALLLARKLGFRIAEVPVDWDNPIESTLKVYRHTVPMLWDVLKTKWRLRGGRATAPHMPSP